jgi:hypothetical protein
MHPETGSSYSHPYQLRAPNFKTRTYRTFAAAAAMGQGLANTLGVRVTLYAYGKGNAFAMMREFHPLPSTPVLDVIDPARVELTLALATEAQADAVLTLLEGAETNGTPVTLTLAVGDVSLTLPVRPEDWRAV